MFFSLHPLNIQLLPHFICLEVISTPKQNVSLIYTLDYTVSQYTKLYINNRDTERERERGKDRCDRSIYLFNTYSKNIKMFVIRNNKKLGLTQ